MPKLIGIFLSLYVILKATYLIFVFLIPLLFGIFIGFIIHMTVNILKKQQIKNLEKKINRKEDLSGKYISLLEKEDRYCVEILNTKQKALNNYSNEYDVDIYKELEFSKKYKSKIEDLELQFKAIDKDKNYVKNSDNIFYAKHFVLINIIIFLLGILFIAYLGNLNMNGKSSYSNSSTKSTEEYKEKINREVEPKFTSAPSVQVIKDKTMPHQPVYNKVKKVEKEDKRLIGEIDYYNLDFENHFVGKLISTDYLFVKFGSPTVVRDYKNNLGNSLLLHNTSSDMYDQIRLKLKKGSSTYTLSYDMFVSNNRRTLTVSLDTPLIRNIDFAPNGVLLTYLMDGVERKYIKRGVYPRNEWFNVNINVNLNKEVLILKINGKKIFSTKFVVSGKDIESLRFRVPKNIKVAIDNLRISSGVKDFYTKTNHIEKIKHVKEDFIESKKDISNIKRTFYATDKGEIVIETKRLKENSLELKVTMKNFTENKSGILSLSFPQISSKNMIDKLSNNGFKKVQFYGKGESIYNVKSKKNIRGKYLLIEGESSTWYKNSNKSFSIILQIPKGIENLNIYLKGSYNTARGIKVFPTDGEYNTMKGQQSFQNYRVKIPIDSSKYVELSSLSDFREETLNEVVESSESNKVIPKKNEYKPIIKESSIPSQSNSNLGTSINGISAPSKNVEDCRNSLLGCSVN